MIFDTLYKKTATGAIQQWTIYVADDKYQTAFGQVDGQIQLSEWTVCKPKNEGRANATTAEQQAEAEAKALWTKKLKSGYVKSLDEAQAGKTDELVEGGIEPMLAQVYWDRHDMGWPAAAQPKLDGMRCIAQVVDGKVTLWSRRRRPVLSVPHIAAAIEELCAGVGAAGPFYLDGELYAHTHKDQFSKLMSLARKGYPGKGFEQLEYHIYDVYDPQAPGMAFKDRHIWLGDFLRTACEPLRQVETTLVTDEEALLAFYESRVLEGYEGAMYRNLGAPYGVQRRSPYLLKIKPEDDREFEILDIIPGEGGAANHGVFVCRSPADAWDPTGKIPKGQPCTFTALLAGTHGERAEVLRNKEKYIGKQLTVLHNGYTDYRQPRNCRGKAIRED